MIMTGTLIFHSVSCFYRVASTSAQFPHTVFLGAVFIIKHVAFVLVWAGRGLLNATLVCHDRPGPQRHFDKLKVIKRSTAYSERYTDCVQDGTHTHFLTGI